MTSIKTRHILPCCIALLVGTLMAVPGHAGTVSGVVSGSGVQHPATMTLTGKHGEGVYSVRTGNDGAYSIFLPVGSYDVTVEGVKEGTVEEVKEECGEIESFDVPVRRDIEC